jgi:hypothetical protein
MPASPRSLSITDAYRDRLSALAYRLGALTLAQWQRITLANLDASHADWLAATVPMLDAAQRAGVRLTAGYLSAFIASELGRPGANELPTIDEAHFAGLAEDGQALAVPLGKTLIGVKAALKDGKTPVEALGEQGTRAVRLASSAVMAAPRAALADQIATHPMLTGWQRVTHGGCGACLAAAARGYDRHEPMHVHAHCHCTAEPIVRDVTNAAPRLTGPEIFHRVMTPAQQDAALGPATAQLARQGRLAWPDLIKTAPMEVGADWITQRPFEQLHAA